MLLVVCAALFLRTLRNASAIDPGFSTRNALLATVDLLPAGYDRARGTVFLQTLLDRLRELPGVEAATTVRRMPLGMTGISDTSFEVVGYTPAPGEEMSTNFSPVGSRYLATMGIGLVEGRDITEGDVAGTRAVVVINETLARRYFSGRPAIGGQLKLFGQALEVVGVARDGKYSTINEAPGSAIYIPVQQFFVPDATLVLATTGDPLSVLPGVQAAVSELDPNVPLFEVRTLAEHLETATFVQSTAASVVTGLGSVALLLAAIGLYGVIAGVGGATDSRDRHARGARRQPPGHRGARARAGRADRRSRLGARRRAGAGRHAAAVEPAGRRDADRLRQLRADRRPARGGGDRRRRAAGPPGVTAGPAHGAATSIGS